VRPVPRPEAGSRGLFFRGSDEGGKDWWSNSARVGTPCCPGYGRPQPGGKAPRQRGRGTAYVPPSLPCQNQPPPRLWKLTGYGKLRATELPAPDLTHTRWKSQSHPPPGIHTAPTASARTICSHTSIYIQEDAGLPAHPHKPGSHLLSHRQPGIIQRPLARACR
jgi:hypothetical protein